MHIYKGEYWTRLALIFGFICLTLGCQPQAKSSASDSCAVDSCQRVILGAERTDLYLPLMQGKRVALYSNHTGIVPKGQIDTQHTLDLLLANSVDVRCIFSPEHGFRGTADAGEQVSSSIDPATGIPIVSLYGRGHAQGMNAALDSIDLVVTDIQDVGLRYYTYYCTMLELMDAAAERGLKFVVLDRPNPNGMYVDGPVLDMKYESGVGRLPIPVVHGLTLGEMARMANGENWLRGKKAVDLDVIPCEGYTHQTRYTLPVPPSPNLPNMKSVYLYPSLCYFEATPVSLGRGTDKPFQIYGHPKMTSYEFSFTPQSRPGAANPVQKGNLCHGVDLSELDDEQIIANGINLQYLIDAYSKVNDPQFFSSFFEKLIGNGQIRQMIIDGKSADEIKLTWEKDVDDFKIRRRQYLLYPE